MNKNTEEVMAKFVEKLMLDKTDYKAKDIMVILMKADSVFQKTDNATTVDDFILMFICTLASTIMSMEDINCIFGDSKPDLGDDKHKK